MSTVKLLWIQIMLLFIKGPVAVPGESKIVGGSAVKIETVPFIVSIQLTNFGHFCGGSLLSLQHVITACHCVATDLKINVTHAQISIRPANQFYVIAGSSVLDTSSKKKLRWREVIKIEIHPKCDYKLILYYDYSIMYLKRPFRKSRSIQQFAYPLKMSFEDFDKETRQLVNNRKNRCYVAGWGATSHGSGVASSVLKAARMRAISDETCAERLSRYNRKFQGFKFGLNSQMCTLSFGRKVNASDCVGDSGGPFYCGRTLYGIVSYGYECGSWDSPNVYAKLSYAMSWINTKNVSIGTKKYHPARTQPINRSVGKSTALIHYSLTWVIITTLVLSGGCRLPAISS